MDRFFKDIPWSILIGTFLIMPFAVFAGRFVNKKNRRTSIQYPILACNDGVYDPIAGDLA